VQGDLLNLTGDSSGTTLFGLLTRQQGPSWFVGTSYGVEVGLAGVVGLSLVAVGVWLWTGGQLSVTSGRSSVISH
jgi:hypothetical protein